MFSFFSITYKLLVLLSNSKLLYEINFTNDFFSIIKRCILPLCACIAANNTATKLSDRTKLISAFLSNATKKRNAPDRILNNQKTFCIITLRRTNCTPDYPNNCEFQLGTFSQFYQTSSTQLQIRKELPTQR